MISIMIILKKKSHRVIIAFLLKSISIYVDDNALVNSYSSKYFISSLMQITISG